MRPDSYHRAAHPVGTIRTVDDRAATSGQRSGLDGELKTSLVHLQ